MHYSKLNKKPKNLINNNKDILIEILTRLDHRSLASAACVCRLWHSVLNNDVLWEHLCFRNFWPPPPRIKPLVKALGGYRRLYTACIRPVLTRVRPGLGYETETVRRRWTRNEVELSLSLFCVEYYERLGGSSGGNDGGGKLGDSSLSLMFLCKPVNV